MKTRLAWMLGGVLLGGAGCTSGGTASDAGITVHTCAEAIAAARGHVPACSWPAHPCATNLLCDGPLTNCMVDLGGCALDSLVCDTGHLVTYNSAGIECDAGPRDAGSPDTSLPREDSSVPPSDAWSERPDLGPPDDAGP
jgi:hypothetical protein